jgi:hypothetical protein
MGKKDVHVVASSGGWAVKRPGSERSSKVTGTQRVFIEAGEKLAECDRSELVVHGEDGRLREKNSYGNDPCPPKG